MANLIELKKYHFIYKTTNLKNDKYYIGMHSTCNLKDGYLGSGTHLRHSIRKHGIENFKCEILEFLTDRQSLASREAEIVNEELIHDEKCMNLKPGGFGGFCSEEHKRKFQAAASESIKIAWVLSAEKRRWLRKNDKEWAIRRDKKASDTLKGRVSPFTGNHHTEETKQKVRNTWIERNLGVCEKNSQYGTCWITNGTENRKIKKEEPIPESWYKGRMLKN